MKKILKMTDQEIGDLSIPDYLVSKPISERFPSMSCSDITSEGKVALYCTFFDVNSAEESGDISSECSDSEMHDLWQHI